MASTLPEGSIARLGHGFLSDIALSPDGEHLVVGTSIGLWWYECVTMTAVDLWDTKQGAISTLSFSSNGKWLATAGEDGSVKVWDVSRRACITRIERREKNNPLTRQDKISRIAFSPDSQQLAVSGMNDYIVDIWHPETGEHLAKINADFQVELQQYCELIRPIAFSPDNQHIACLTPHIPSTSSEPEAEAISVWDVSGGARVASLTKYPPGVMWYAFCFSPCGESLVTSGDIDDKLQVWQTTNWKKIKAYPDYGVNQMIPAYSAKGVLHAAAVSNSTNTITVWNVEHNKKIHTSQNDNEIMSFYFMNGTQLAIASSHGFKVDSADTQQTVTSIHSHATSIPGSLIFSNDGKNLAAGYLYDGIWLWNIDASSQRPIVFKPAGKKHCVYASADREIYTTSMNENTVNVWKFGNHDIPIAEFKFKERPTYNAVAFAPENQLLVYGDSKGRLHVWNLQYGEEVYTYIGHETSVYSIKFSPNGKQLASSGEIGPDFQLWDMERAEKVREFPSNLRDIAFSPCGNRIACASTKRGEKQSEILLWDATHRQTQMVISKPEIWTYQGPWNDVVAFSPCGRYLASGSCWAPGMEKSLVQLWEVVSGENIATFEGHTRGISDLTFSPNTELLASASYDASILLWDMKPYL
jgi:WD40 repeat protein